MKSVYNGHRNKWLVIAIAGVSFVILVSDEIECSVNWHAEGTKIENSSFLFFQRVNINLFFTVFLLCNMFWSMGMTTMVYQEKKTRFTVLWLLPLSILNAKPAFSNYSILKRVYVKLRFRDGLYSVDDRPDRGNKARGVPPHKGYVGMCGPKG